MLPQFAPYLSFHRGVHLSAVLLLHLSLYSYICTSFTGSGIYLLSESRKHVIKSVSYHLQHCLRCRKPQERARDHRTTPVSCLCTLRASWSCSLVLLTLAALAASDCMFKYILDQAEKPQEEAGGSEMTTTRRRSSIEESAWVAEVEREVAEGCASEQESARWRQHCIYPVPDCIKNLNPRAYRPQVVSLGPFHHGEPQLRPMDAHKRRSLVHFLRRARRPLADFAAAVAGTPLEGAYQGLGDEWRVDGGEARFVELMVTDGCFLLEIMRTATGWEMNDYADDDPVFSAHGLLYTVPYIRRDMLMIENQLPLLVLERLLAVESGKNNGNDDLVNRLVLRFLSPASRPLATGVGLALHPLDVLHQSLLYGPKPVAGPRVSSSVPIPTDDIIRSAEELHEAGVRFKRSATSSLLDIRFHRGTLYLPAIAVDDTTEYMLLNLMALERLHVGAGNDVTAYVFFMDNMVDSARDVALLTSRRILHNALGSDKAVARLFNGLSRDVVLEPLSALDDVHREVNAYCRKRWNQWRANLVHTYFRSPWSFLSLTATIFLLVLTIAQTVYTILPYYSGNS